MFSIIQIVGAYCGLLVVVGTAANLTVFRVSLRFTSNTTFIFMLYMSICDLVALWFWNLNHFVYAYFGLDLQNYNLISCKIGGFYQMASLHCSAWLLVLISFDRYLSVAITAWKTTYFRPKRAYLAATLCVIFFVGINAHIPFLYGIEYNINGTIVTVCYGNEDPATAWMQTWSEVYTILYSYVPFALLITSNILLISTVYWKGRSCKALSTSKNRKQRSMNRTVISITLIFVIMTAFNTVGSIFYNSLVQTTVGVFVLFFCDAVSFSYHGLNFLILFYTNRKFRAQLAAMIAGGNAVQSTLSRSTLNTINNPNGNRPRDILSQLPFRSED